MRRLLPLALLFVARGGFAHPLAPSLLELREIAPGRAAVLWKTPARRVPGSDLRPLLSSDCTTIGEPVTTAGPLDVLRRWEIQCASGTLVGVRIEVAGIAESRADVLVRIGLADGRRLLRVLRADEPVLVVPARDPLSRVLWSYGRLGVEHILTGFDHLLFVLGLVLLVGRRRRLLWTVTAFTLGHSVTLSLAVLGFVDVPSAPVEALIALSIFVLAVELTRTGRSEPTLLQRYPWAMAFSFGLLHGLGFAGALAEVGLPAGDIPLALFSFNLGIEVGQVAFIAVVLALGAGLAPLLARSPVRVAWVPAYVIGSLAAYWLFERVAATL